jgi:hypothetical protein
MGPIGLFGHLTADTIHFFISRQIGVPIFIKKPTVRCQAVVLKSGA